MKKKIVAFILVFAIALALGIGGTLAWLTATSGQVVNTFTVGDINLQIREEGAPANNEYKIVPGGTADKKPIITVTEGSEKCYVYACVENTVELTDGTKVATPNIGSDWVKVGETGNKAVYRYVGEKATNNVIDASAAQVEVTVFDKVTYSDAITKANRDQVTTATDKITVQGYAYQAENRTQADADAAACAQFSVAAITSAN